MARSAGDLSGLTILCMATQGWDAHWTPVQQVMLRLTPQNRVIYFEPFHPPFAWLKASNTLLRRQRQQRVPQLREVRPNLFVYRPSSWYFPQNWRVPASAKANGPIYRAEIRRLMKRLDVDRAWLWAFFVQHLSVLDLPFERFIYDCVDDWPSFFIDPRERRYVAYLDEHLCRRAGLVFVGSEPLRAKKASFNPNTFVVNHAADIDHFARATDPQTVVPADLERIPHPRVGFVGMVDRVRFDAELVLRLAEDPALQIVIVGGAVGGAENILEARPNIHWLGMKSVAELPRYLKGLDVCLMPYRLNEATRNIYPLKLHEYLATGRPVVATSIPAVESVADLVYVAASAADFCGKVGVALKERDAELVRRRRAHAAENTWEAHIDRKAVLIGQHLPAS